MRGSSWFILIVLILGTLAYAWRKGYFESSTEVANRNFSIHYDMAQELYASEKYEEAIAEFQKALLASPRNVNAPDALMRMGDSYRALKWYKQALEAYDRVLYEFPDYKMLNLAQHDHDVVKSFVH